MSKKQPHTRIYGIGLLYPYSVAIVRLRRQRPGVAVRKVFLVIMVDMTIEIATADDRHDAVQFLRPKPDGT